jgi:hypothetical protein
MVKQTFSKLSKFVNLSGRYISDLGKQVKAKQVKKKKKENVLTIDDRRCMVNDR